MASVWKFVTKNEISYPSTAFLLNTKNASARCVKNRVNLCTRMCSISSYSQVNLPFHFMIDNKEGFVRTACFILKLTLTELTLASIRTRSSAFRLTIKGFSNSSGEVWASISGTLWRSEAWEAKFERERAAVRVLRTAER
ncbi:hypothetical protein Tdes44962_MAKER05161 [Teratosphaeria destructans]|uniref:Uncharacterized protein n=1 Tax=Teratosphaeria destructans TaxID=418781 RepID=A0A9W7SL08_9PEZI|nr:hypothetical protein Tdes44962_MAKER05161 [Teratosphaeria destructans]